MVDIARRALALARTTCLSQVHIIELWLQFLKRNCNLRCVHCYVPGEEVMPGALLSPERYVEALRGVVARKEFNHFNRSDIVFPGMEPLMPENEPWFRPLMEEAVKLNRGSIGITTNGTLLNKKNVAFLSDASLRIRHPFTINISIDGDEETHDRQRRGRGLWRKAMKGIRRLAEAGCFNVVTNTTITSLNARILSEIAVLSNEGGANIAAFHPYEDAHNATIAPIGRSEVAGGVRKLVAEFEKDDRMKCVVLEFEASTAGIFFALFANGVFDGWKLVGDEAQYMFLQKEVGGRMCLAQLLFHPHHFIRTMRLMPNGGFASCRSMALRGWKTVGHWQMPYDELREACIPLLADIWLEYLDSTASVESETWDTFTQCIEKG